MLIFFSSYPVTLFVLHLSNNNNSCYLSLLPAIWESSPSPASCCQMTWHISINLSSFGFSYISTSQLPTVVAICLADFLALGLPGSQASVRFRSFLKTARYFKECALKCFLGLSVLCCNVRPICPSNDPPFIESADFLLCKFDRVG